MKITHSNDYTRMIIMLLANHGYDVNKYYIESILKSYNNINNLCKSIHLIIEGDYPPALLNHRIITSVDKKNVYSLTLYDIISYIINYPDHKYTKELISDIVPKFPSILFKNCNIEIDKWKPFDDTKEILYSVDKLSSIFIYSDLNNIDILIYKLRDIYDWSVVNKLVRLNIRMILPYSYIELLSDNNLSHIIIDKNLYNMNDTLKYFSLKDKGDSLKYVPELYDRMTTIHNLSKNNLYLSMNTGYDFDISLTFEELNKLINIGMVHDNMYNSKIMVPLYLFLSKHNIIKNQLSDVNKSE